VIGRYSAQPLVGPLRCVRNTLRRSWQHEFLWPLTYAPFESSRLGRAVTRAEMIGATADVYQRDIDQKLGLLSTVAHM
jgi:hypothetical protein